MLALYFRRLISALLPRKRGRGQWYLIGRRCWQQQELVLGQWRQLMAILQGLEFPADADLADVIHAIGDRMPHVLAVLLTPEGESLEDKNLGALAVELENAITGEQALEVVEDFFLINRADSIFKKVGRWMMPIARAREGTPSRRSSSPSQPETSPDETTSSGG